MSLNFKQDFFQDVTSEPKEHLARVVELRFFSGLEVPETAEILGISESTVKRDWAMAKAWWSH